MIVFERIFLYLFGERWSSSWKCSRRMLRSFSSGVYRVSVKEDIMFDCVRFLGNFSDFFETGLLWLKKYSYLAVGFGA